MDCLLLTGLLLPVAWWDYKHGLIYNRWNVVIFLAGILTANNLSLSELALSGVVGAGSLFALRVLSHGGIGWGDIKLLMALSAWLNWQQQLLSLLLAFWLGGGYGALLLLTGKGKLKMTVPFGPFLVCGALAAFTVGQEIIVWYMEYFYG